TNLFETIRSQADSLLRQFGEYSPARKAVEEIQRAVVAADQMNRRLAVFGTRQVSQPEVLRLNATIRSMSKLLETVTGPAIQLPIRTGANTARVKVDAEQIEQAIMTLVMHSCATLSRTKDEKPRLLIETGSTEIPVDGHPTNFVMLALSHTGEEEDPERLFEP